MRALTWLTALAVAVVVPGLATSATIHVPGDYPTIQAGINAASYGDTVLVYCGTYYDCTHIDPSGLPACIIVKDGVVLVSEGSDPDCVTVDAQTLGRCVYCGSVDSSTLIEGFTFVNGRATGSSGAAARQGGGMLCDANAAVTVRDCVFSASYASAAGGGVACRSSSPVFEDLMVAGNSSSSWGGGIYCSDADVTVIGGSITQNASDSGAGLDSDYGDISMTDVFISGNVAEYGGGGVAISGGTPTITNCEIIGNIAVLSWGGGAYLKFCSPTLEGCTFDLNEAAYGGGVALFHLVDYGPAYMTACDFRDNAASERGGGMHVGNSSTAVVTQCSFERNEAPIGGGASFVEGTGTLAGCFFTENSAGEKGGGIGLLNSSLSADECRLEHNTSSTFGGGIQAESGAAVELSDCLLAGNHATYLGGAIQIHTSSPLTMTGCTLVENASLTGGGVGVDDSAPMLIENSIIAFGTEGPAVTCTGATPPEVRCSDVFGNAGGDWVDCIAGLAGIDGNISQDPLFCGAAGPNHYYGLHSNSPCTPEANPACGLIGAFGVDCGSTPVSTTSWGALKALFR